MKTTTCNRVGNLKIWTVVACLAAGLPASGESKDPGAEQTLKRIGHLVDSCESYRIDNEHYPGPTQEFVSAEFLESALSPVYIRKLPTLDGWGNPLSYASDGERLAILSYGPDGLADRDYPLLDAVEPSEGEGDDLVWSDGDLIVCPTSICQLQRLRNQKQTMADIRSVAIAVEAFRIDNELFPGPTEGYVPLATIRHQVEPFYIRRLPLADAWSNTLLYWSDGEHYRIASPAANGSPEQPYSDVIAGTATFSFASDIVFGDGEFLQWPEGDQQ